MAFEWVAKVRNVHFDAHASWAKTNMDSPCLFCSLPFLSIQLVVVKYKLLLMAMTVKMSESAIVACLLDWAGLGWVCT